MWLQKEKGQASKGSLDHVYCTLPLDIYYFFFYYYIIMYVAKPFLYTKGMI